MRRRVPLQNLRGSDKMLLEVQCQDLLRLPSGQLEPANLCDLFALSEVDDCPKSLRHGLAGFVSRASAEIAEISDSQLSGFAEDFASLEGARVPQSFRALLTELAQRESRDPKHLQALLDGWAGTEPEPFAFGSSTVRVQRASAVKSAPSKTRTRRERGSSSSGSSSNAPRKSTARPKPVMDVDRRNWIVETVLERLSASRETGLGETVLIAGIRHRARSEYPNLAPHEIVMVLNELAKTGRVRKSAGRWSRSR